MAKARTLRRRRRPAKARAAVRGERAGAGSARAKARAAQAAGCLFAAQRGLALTPVGRDVVGAEEGGPVAVEKAVGRAVKAAQGLDVVSQQLPLVDELYVLLPAWKLGPFRGASGVVEPDTGHPL